MRLVPLALSFLVVGCYQLDADISGLAVSAGDQTFDGAGAGAGQPVQLDRLITFDGASSLASKLRGARIDTVTLSPATGVTSLELLSSVTLILHTDHGDVPLIDAAGKMTSPDGTVLLPINVDVDPALLAAPIDIAASLRFVAPADAWSMHIDAALTLHGHADLKL